MSVSPGSFQSALDDLAGLLDSLPAEWRAIADDVAARRPRPDAWSAKEVVGHLIDSAGVNLQRFIRGQIGPGFAMLYPQNEFVASQRYQERPWAELVELWTALNRHVLHVARGIPADKLNALCGDGPAGEDWTIGFRVVDYVAHIRHHLPQIRRAAGQEQPS